jgi:signal transduction histidine kinase
LVDDAVAAGAPTELEVHGSLVGLPRPVTLAAYRIVQESLTNAIRYTGGKPTRILIRVTATNLEITVDTEGEIAGNGSIPGSGRGLAGMRERACALGGSFDAGPQPNDGWRVHAVLPLAPARPAAETRHPDLTVR